MSQTCKLSNVLEEYIRKNQRLKWNTLYLTKGTWAKLIKAKGDMVIGDFTSNIAEDFQASLFDEGLKPGAVKSYIKMTMCVTSWAQRRGCLDHNPFEGFKFPRVPQKEIRVFTEAELTAMIEAAPNDFCDMWQARIIAAASAGLRRSEALNLKVSNVDLDRGEIRIQANKGSNEVWPYCPKDYESRRVPLTEQLSQLFVRILSELPPGQPYWLLTEKRYWHLQQLRKKGKMSPRMMVNPDDTCSRRFKKILRNAQISDGSYHDLRSTAITRWLLAGLAPQEVQKLAGHSDIETTMTYYAACRPDIVDRARQAWSIGATGLEPATS